MKKKRRRKNPSRAGSIADVIIVGAGIAGLACANRLIEGGKSVVLLEARSRIGGRAQHAKLHGSMENVDLGPEFVHGNPPALMKKMENLKQHLYDVRDVRRFFSKSGKIEEVPEYWDELEREMQSLSKLKKDISVGEFLKHSRLNVRHRQMFQSYVEGFHSADLGLISAKGLSESEEASEEPDLNGAQLFRPLRGFSNFFDALIKKHPDTRRALRLETEIKKISFNDHGVEVQTTGRLKVYRARKIVLAVPLAILKLPSNVPGGIEWHPQKPEYLEDVLQSMETGHIQKLVLEFKTRFLEKRVKEAPSFFHTTPEAYFPTWWTLAPLRTPLLVAWQGGPKALEMATWSQDEKVAKALGTLALLAGRTRSWLEGDLVSCKTHNWSRDPYARGAYSYIRVGGVETARRARRRFGKNVYLAGEWCAVGSARGTVHGALESGEHAAGLILKS